MFRRVLAIHRASIARRSQSWESRRRHNHLEPTKPIHAVFVIVQAAMVMQEITRHNCSFLVNWILPPRCSIRSDVRMAVTTMPSVKLSAAFTMLWSCEAKYAARLMTTPISRSARSRSAEKFPYESVSRNSERPRRCPARPPRLLRRLTRHLNEAFLSERRFLKRLGILLLKSRQVFADWNAHGSRLTITGRCRFPSPRRSVFCGSGRIVAHWKLHHHD